MNATPARRLLTEPDKRLLWKFIYNFGWQGMRSVQKFKKRLKRGEHFPAFLFISVTNNCNLSCQGCWATPTKPPRQIAPGMLKKLIDDSKQQGVRFFGILGGEPLLYPELFEIFAQHPDCYFLLFTNGTMIDQQTAHEMRMVGNVSPLISVEGLEDVSDERRGGNNVYARTLEGLEHCRRQRLVTGVSTSICQSNFADLASAEFADAVAERGAHYLWYYIYRPVGPRPQPELALTAEQIIDLRRFIVDIRNTAPLMVIDSYWDHNGRALCPAATGIAHHISPAGAIEPCPPIQFARDNIGDSEDIYSIFNDSVFMKDFRSLCTATTQGCILLEDPAKLRCFMVDSNAQDSSGRNTVFDEMAVMDKLPGHNQPDNEIPEKSWPYKFAKKNWFFGFGAYG